MDSPAQSPASSPQLKGFATIALASAAGVIVASRMNRPALMLTAGLALAWWQKRSQAPTSPVAEASETAAAPVVEEPIPEVIPESIPVQVVEEEAPIAPVVCHEPEAPLSIPEPVAPVVSAPVMPDFPEAPVRPSESPLSAWDDLRAALSPVLGRGTAPTEPLPPVPEFSKPVEFPKAEEITHEAPPMPDFSFAMATSPLIASEDDEEEVENEDEAEEVAPPPSTHLIPRIVDVSGPIPDEIDLPAAAESSPAEDVQDVQPLIPEVQPEEVPTSPIPRPRPIVVPKSDAATSAPEISAQAAQNPLTAPIVVPREVQAKKSFFDWLRN